VSTQNPNPKYAHYQTIETTLQDQIKKLTYGSITLDEKAGQTMSLQQMGASLSNNPNLKNITNTPTFIQIEQNLSNPDLVKAQLAKFFWTLDFMPKDTYDAFFKTLKEHGIDANVLSEYLQSPNAVLSDQNKLAQLYAIESILNEWQQKGYFKQTPDEDPMYKASGDMAKLGQNWMEQNKKRWEQIQKDIEQGKIPDYGGGASDTALNIFSKADIINDTIKAVEGTLGKGLSSLAIKLGANESVANEIGHDASMAVSGAVLGLLTMFPGVNALLITDAIIDGIAQIASSLDTPLEKQQLLEMIKDKSFWVNSAKDVALMAGGGLAGSALAEQVNSALVKRISQINPDLGAKLTSKFGTTQGIPLYNEQKASYYIDHDAGKVYFRIQGSGKVIPVSTEKLSSAIALLQDPETGSKVASIIGKFGSEEQANNFLNMLNDLSKGLGTEKTKELINTLNTMKPEDIKGIASIGVYSSKPGTEAIDLGGRLVILTKDKPSATLLNVKDIPKNEFGLYNLADETGIGVKTLDNVLRRALNKETGILYKQSYGNGDLVIASDGKELKIALGKESYNIPLNAITLDNWQKVLNVMGGLKSSVDPSTYESVMNLLRTQYSLTTPITPTASNVINAEGLFRADAQSLYDLLNKKFGFSAPSDIQKSASLSLSTKIDGKPYQIVVNKQVLGDDKTRILVNELTTREFNRSLFGKVGFKEDDVGVIKIQKSLKYFGGASTFDKNTISNAIEQASRSGDAEAVEELSLIQQAIKQIESGKAQPIVIGESEDEVAFVIGGAGAQSLNALQKEIQEAKSKGDAQALEKALREAGLSEGAISRLVVKVPQIVEQGVVLEKIIPSAIAETEEVHSTDKVMDKVVKIPKPIEVTEEQEVVVQVPEIETDVTFGKETATDRVVKIPKLIYVEEQNEKTSPAVEFEENQAYFTETVPGTVVAVPVQVQIPYYQFSVVDVIEPAEEPATPVPVSASPTATPPLVPPIPLALGGGSFGPALSGAPAPKGKSEKEKLVI
jgi:hypothetical protein